MKTSIKEMSVCEQIIINGGQVQEGAYYWIGRFFRNLADATDYDRSHVMARRAV